MLVKYEEDTITTYADSNANKLVLGDINDPELKEKGWDLQNQLKNPFLEFFNWVRGECDDIEALYEAMKGRDRVMEFKNKLTKKKNDDAAALAKLSAGGKTLKTLFKSEAGK